MQNSGLCNSTVGIDPAVNNDRRMEVAAQKSFGAQQEEQLARDFAEVFYTIVVKEMKKTIQRPEQDSVAEGVSGLIGMYLPRSMAGRANDPLKSYFYDHLTSQFGANIDEGA